jgi:hypothetical protein
MKRGENDPLETRDREYMLSFKSKAEDQAKASDSEYPAVPPDIDNLSQVALPRTAARQVRGTEAA